MIKVPKIIHYCWYGENKKTKLVKDCIKSWKKHLPDYKIIEWNEKNSDLSHPFVKDAYRKKKWAFVSDYIRLQMLYEFGGIYLDTDVIVLKSFEPLINQGSFLGAEDSFYINAAIIGATPKNNFIKVCVNAYDSIKLDEFSHLGEVTIPKIITKEFRAFYNFNNDFSSLVINNDMKIYPAFYFYALPYKKKEDFGNYKMYVTKKSYAVHLWNASWVECSEFHYFRTRQYIKGFSKMIKIVLESKELKYVYFRKIGACIKESLKSKN